MYHCARFVKLLNKCLRKPSFFLKDTQDVTFGYDMPCTDKKHLLRNRSAGHTRVVL